MGQSTVCSLCGILNPPRPSFLQTQQAACTEMILPRHCKINSNQQAHFLGQNTGLFPISSVESRGRNIRKTTGRRHLGRIPHLLCCLKSLYSLGFLLVPLPLFSILICSSFNPSPIHSFTYLFLYSAYIMGCPPRVKLQDR